MPCFLWGQWTQIGQDLNGDADSDWLGESVSFNTDGTILAVGAKGHNGNGSNSGMLRVYENVGGVWTQVGQDVYGSSASATLGHSIALNDLGTVAIVSAFDEDEQASYAG